MDTLKQALLQNGTGLILIVLAGGAKLIGMADVYVGLLVGGGLTILKALPGKPT